MKKLVVPVLFLLIFLCNPYTFAQLKDYGIKIGLQGNYLLPANEFTEEEFNPSLLFRPHIAFPLSHLIDLDIGLGYGWNQGEDFRGDQYKFDFIPLDLRLVVNPFRPIDPVVNPYIYLGGGIAYWNLSDPPANRVGDATDDNGITGLGEAGIGLEIPLSKNWLLDITGGFNLFTSDDVNGQSTNLQDNTLHDYDRYINIGLGVSYVTENCHTDEDNDLLEKCTEDSIGTDPLNPDTDGDMLLDGEEYMKYKTDPKNPDSDGDGLKDGQEVNTTKTNPLNRDTDADLLTDGEEVNQYTTDPNNPDTDGDALRDGDEVLQYKTDPLKADTDGDTVNDGSEVNGTNLDLKVVGKTPETLSVKTDPLNRDSDGDNLSDGEELTRYYTDPNNIDTDAGSIPDGVEANRKTDPLDPYDDVAKPEEGIKLVIEFAQGKAEVRPQYFGELERALGYMQRNTSKNFEIHGYTSTEGSTKSNQKLSDRRTASVVAWFASRGIDQSRLKAVGHGECCPIMVDGKEDRPASRRIMMVPIEVTK